MATLEFEGLDEMAQSLLRNASPEKRLKVLRKYGGRKRLLLTRRNSPKAIQLVLLVEVLPCKLEVMKRLSKH